LQAQISRKRIGFFKLASDCHHNAISFDYLAYLDENDGSLNSLNKAVRGTAVASDQSIRIKGLQLSVHHFPIRLLSPASRSKMTRYWMERSMTLSDPVGVERLGNGLPQKYFIAAAGIIRLS
jgi:hypothetical protein